MPRHCLGLFTDVVEHSASACLRLVSSQDKGAVVEVQVAHQGTVMQHCPVGGGPPAANQGTLPLPVEVLAPPLAQGARLPWQGPMVHTEPSRILSFRWHLASVERSSYKVLTTQAVSSFAFVMPSHCLDRNRWSVLTHALQRPSVFRWQPFALEPDILSIWRHLYNLRKGGCAVPYLC